MTQIPAVAPTQLPPADLLPDEEVVARVLRGERALFELLMRRHNPLVYRTIRGILRDDSEVEDVMQETYVSAYSHLASFRATARVSTWLARIAINAALQRLRKRGETVELRSDLEGPSLVPVSGDAPFETPETHAMAHEASRALQNALEQLTPPYRVVFVLREVEGLSTAEVAAALEISEDNVKQRLHRAKGYIREALYAQVGEHAREVFAFHATRCDRVVGAVMAKLNVT
jgi:RNA polymerase sigma-70 factor (ECF subfamily)